MSSRYTYTTQAQVRAAFWRDAAGLDWRIKHKGKKQNDCPADVRMAFCDFVESLNRSGAISEALTQRITL